MRFEALSAKMYAVAGTINSAKNIVYAMALARGKQNEHFVSSSGVAAISNQAKVGDVFIEYGYFWGYYGSNIAEDS